MGTYTLREKNITNFWTDTLSCFCKGVIAFKDEFCLQGNLEVVIDQQATVHLNIDKTIQCDSGKDVSPGEEGRMQAKDARIGEILNDKESVAPNHYVKDDKTNADILSSSVRGVESFLCETLKSFCRNMIQYKSECVIRGKLCITIDREDAMLVDIQEKVRLDDYALLTSLLNESDNAKITSQLVSTPQNPEAHHFSPTPIVIVPNADLIEEKHSSSPKMSSSNQNKNVSKRKRKQANPISLSQQGTSPKVIVIEPETDIGVGGLENSNLPVNSNQDVRTQRVQPENVALNALVTNGLMSGDLASRVPLMVHLLMKNALDQMKANQEAQKAANCELDNLPPLISQAGPTANLNTQSSNGNLSRALINSESQYDTAIPNNNLTVGSAVKSSVGKKESNAASKDGVQNTVIEINDDTAVACNGKAGKTTSPKKRYVNSLLDLPDEEVQGMLSALMASGQTKDTCDKQHCNICCPTLAYIRFRDRNRKNKSRFSMEKIEQVVNVQMYGGGTKYRDVQRMFTTYLRKLRAKHMCEKDCICCEKLLLRESKKPNSNYLPHNVTPYKNPPTVRTHILPVNVTPDSSIAVKQEQNSVETE